MGTNYPMREEAVKQLITLIKEQNYVKSTDVVSTVVGGEGKPVSSGGVHTALDAVQKDLQTSVDALDTEVTQIQGVLKVNDGDPNNHYGTEVALTDLRYIENPWVIKSRLLKYDAATHTLTELEYVPISSLLFYLKDKAPAGAKPVTELYSYQDVWGNLCYTIHRNLALVGNQSENATWAAYDATQPLTGGQTGTQYRIKAPTQRILRVSEGATTQTEITLQSSGYYWFYVPAGQSVALSTPPKGTAYNVGESYDTLEVY